MTLRSRPLSRRTAVKAGAGLAGAAAAAAYVSYPIRSSAQGTTTVRLSTPSNNAELTFLQNQVNAFQDANPDIEVKIESIPDAYSTALTTNLAAGTAADVVFVDALQAPDLMVRGQLEPLDSYIASSGGTEDFFPNLLRAFQYNGTTYGLPKDWSSLAMFYNGALFQQAGVTTAPTNWDELTSTLQTLTDSTGIPGLALDTQLARLLPFILQAGGGVLSPDGSQILIGQPATAEALNLVLGYYNDGLATTPADAGAGSTQDVLGQQQSCSTFDGNWVYGAFEQNYPDLELEAAPLPNGPAGPATLAFTVSWSIFAGSQLKDAAWRVVNYLTGEGMLSWTTQFGVMPSRASVSSQWAAQYPQRQFFIDAAQYATPWQFGPGGQLFIDQSNSILQSLFAGQIDVDEAVSQLQQQAESTIQLQAPSTATPGATPEATLAATPEATPSS